MTENRSDAHRVVFDLPAAVWFRVTSAAERRGVNPGAVLSAAVHKFLVDVDPEEEFEAFLEAVAGDPVRRVRVLAERPSDVPRRAETYDEETEGWRHAMRVAERRAA